MNLPIFPINEITENFVDAGIMPLSLILIGFLVLKSIEISVGLASTLVGGSSATDFQKKIAKAAATAAKAVISWATSGAAKIFMKNEKIAAMHEKAQNMKKEIQERMNKLAGRE